jgi:hypothetical protein
VLRAALRHRLPVLLMGFAFLVLTVQVYARWRPGRRAVSRTWSRATRRWT